MATASVESVSDAVSIQWSDHKGHLLLIQPLEKVEDIKTANFGVKDATRANLWAITGKGEYEEYLDILVFPGILQSTLRRPLQKKGIVVGRLEQGTATPGQQPPWVLSTANEKEVKSAQKLWDKVNTTAVASTSDEEEEDTEVEDDDDTF